MEEFHPHNDEMTFNSEEAHSIIKDCIEGVLAKADYNHDKVNQWTAAIVEQSLTHLVKLGKTYKYIVTCAIMQKCGAGLHTASSCFWDTTTDGKCHAAESRYLHNQMGKQNYELCCQRLCCSHYPVANWTSCIKLCQSLYDQKLSEYIGMNVLRVNVAVMLESTASSA